MTIIKEITLLEFKDNGKKYKVTKKVPELGISITKFFGNLNDAKSQVDEWY